MGERRACPRVSLHLQSAEASKLSTSNLTSSPACSSCNEPCRLRGRPSARGPEDNREHTRPRAEIMTISDVSCAKRRHDLRAKSHGRGQARVACGRPSLVTFVKCLSCASADGALTTRGLSKRGTCFILSGQPPCPASWLLSNGGKESSLLVLTGRAQGRF